MKIVRANLFCGLLSVSLLSGTAPGDEGKKGDHYLDDVSLSAFKFRSIGHSKQTPFKVLKSI